MKTILNLSVKVVTLGIVLSALLILNQGAARADEITVTGSTTGTVSGVTQLTFTGNAHFTGTTALAIGSLSGPNSLGSFFLSTDPITQALSGSFTLNITFTAPAGITGGQGTVYTATINGTVSPNINQGGVNITFTNPSQTFTFSNSTGSGAFSLTVANLFVQTGQAANLTAGFNGSQSSIPEPATLVLLGTGLSGLAGMARKRMKRDKSS